MARPLRLEFPGALYHLTARGNERRDIYRDDGDRVRFLDLLEREIQQQAWHCHAYCLMNNHYHLLIETPEANLVQGMRRLNGVYTQTFNHRHGRAGHLFQGRYKSIIVDKDSYLLELCRYIVLNPVRASLTAKAEDWRWSSYRATAGLATAPQWLTTNWVLSQFGKTTKKAQRDYQKFVSEGMEGASPFENLHGQIWLGKKEFLARMDRLIEGQSLNDVPAIQARPSRPAKDDILNAAAEVYGVTPAEILSRTHQPAFQAAVYLLRRATNMTLKEVATLCGVSPSRVSHIQRHIEKGIPDKHLMKLLERCKVKN
ncbi:MAG TPA: transposase [Gammaproteobacteria bacterium]